MVRAYLAWVPICVLGAAVFAGLSWGAMQTGVALGAEYTGNLELVRFIVGFAVVAALYAIAAWELFVYRERARCVGFGRVVGGGLFIVVGGMAGALLVMLFSAVR